MAYYPSSSEEQRSISQAADQDTQARPVDGHRLRHNMATYTYIEDGLTEKCDICGKGPPHPPHPLDSHSLFNMTIHLCPGCCKTAKRTIMDLMNGLRKIRGQDSALQWPEASWK
jgi:hypothetical protein